MKDIISRITRIINDGVVLMTGAEEIEYKQKIVDDLQEWVNELKNHPRK